jgi:DNA polymerase
VLDRLLSLFDSGEPADRAAALGRLRREVEAARCPAGTRPVFSEGNPGARLMIVGEAPAEADEQTGRPFSDPAGRLLRASLDTAGIASAAVYLTNVVKCRSVTPEGGVLRTRPPTPDEIERWAAVLDREIQIVRPRLILALGATATTRLLGPGPALAQRRGAPQHTRYGIPCLPTFHPTYLLRLEGEERTAQEALFRADLALARRLIEAR